LFLLAEIWTSHRIMILSKDLKEIEE